VNAEAVFRRFEVQVVDGAILGGVEGVLASAERAGVSADRRPRHSPLVLDVRLSGRALAVSKVLADLRGVSGVRISKDRIKIRPDRRDRPNGHVYPDRRALFRMGVDPVEPADATARAPGADPVVVAIVDSGITVDHPILRRHLWTGDHGIHGMRFINGVSDRDITDENGHGTMLAGVVLAAAARDPAVRIMTAKFFDAATPARPDNAASAIDFAVRHGAHIINLSWSVGLGSARLKAAVEHACQHALVVIAAGNFGSDNDHVFRAPPKYVLDLPGAITVMATDADDEKAWFSNYGRKSVDLAAPGVGIVSTRRFLSRTAAAGSREFRTYSGTSAAAAFVSGAAALLKSRNSALTAKELKTRLMDAVDEVPSLKRRCVRGGRLNIGKALAG
jgi:subtilisin family serine protease